MALRKMLVSSCSRTCDGELDMGPTMAPTSLASGTHCSPMSSKDPAAYYVGSSTRIGLMWLVNHPAKR